MFQTYRSLYYSFIVANSITFLRRAHLQGQQARHGAETSLVVSDVGNNTVVVEVHVQSVLSEVPGEHGSRGHNTRGLRKILLAEGLPSRQLTACERCWGGRGKGLTYRLVGLGVMELLADELVRPLLGLGVGGNGSGGDERHDCWVWLVVRQRVLVPESVYVYALPRRAATHWKTFGLIREIHGLGKADLLESSGNDMTNLMSGRWPRSQNRMARHLIVGPPPPTAHHLNYGTR